MADPNDPNVIEKLKAVWADASAKAQHFREEATRLGKELGETSVKTKAAAEAAAEWAIKTEQAASKLPAVIRNLIATNAEATLTTKILGDLGSVFGSSGKEALDLGTKIGTSLIAGFVKLGGSILAVRNSTVQNFINPIGEANLLISKSDTFLGGLNNAISSLIKTQNVARSSFIRVGMSMKEADEAAEKYPQTLRAMSAAFGLTTKSLHEMGTTLQGVPDALNEVGGAQTHIAGLQKSMIQPAVYLATVMRAFGKDTAEAAKLGSQAWFDFNQKPVETANLMGTVARAAKEGGVDFGKTADQVLEASGSMAIFGGKTTAAVNVWNSFRSALRDSGVPITQMGAMVKDVTNSMANMTTQNRAFIGLMSGMARGRTALGGALQMEINMRTPGGLEKNLESMTSTLARFGGGKIITLEQAANNPQLEMQFVLQRQMLGKLTNITNTEQQNRILETLSNVQRGGISRLQGSKDLQESFAKGKDLQLKQLTVLEQQNMILRSTIGGKLDKVLESINKIGGPDRVGARVSKGAGGALGLQRQGLLEGGRGTEAMAHPRFKAGAAELIGQLPKIMQNLKLAEEGNQSSILDTLKQLSTTIARALRGGGPQAGQARVPTMPPALPNLAAMPPSIGENLLQEGMGVSRPTITPTAASVAKGITPATAGSPISKIAGETESTLLIKLVGEPNTAAFKKAVIDLIKEKHEELSISSLGIQK